MFPQAALSGDGTAGKSNALQSYIHQSCSASMLLQIVVLPRVSFSNQENKLQRAVLNALCCCSTWAGEHAGQNHLSAQPWLPNFSQVHPGKAARPGRQQPRPQHCEPPEQVTEQACNSPCQSQDHVPAVISIQFHQMMLPWWCSPTARKPSDGNTAPGLHVGPHLPVPWGKAQGFVPN